MQRFRSALEWYEQAVNASIRRTEAVKAEELRRAREAHDAANARVGRLAAEATEAAIRRAVGRAPTADERMRAIFF